MNLLFFSCLGGVNGRTACAAGTANPNSGSSASSACVACNSDEISTAGSSACIKCPAGFRCSSLTTQNACASPSYSLEGETVCTFCPAGSVCPTTNQPPQVMFIFLNLILPENTSFNFHNQLK